MSGKRLRAEVVLGAAHEGPRDELVAGQGVGGEPEVDQLCDFYQNIILLSLI